MIMIYNYFYLYWNFRFSDEGGHTIASIGTTAEIFSVKDETDDRTGLASIRVKAKGRQRFKVIESRRTATGYDVLNSWFIVYVLYVKRERERGGGRTRDYIYQI